MHILFLTRRFYPDIGGVEKHVFELSKELLKRKHKVTIIVEMPSSFAAPDSEIYQGINIFRINSGKDNWFKKFRIWKEMWRLRSFIQKADVIHCHDVFFWYLPFRLRFFTKPVYTTFHGYEGYPIANKAIFMRKISEVLSFGNICIGDFMKKWYGTTPTYVSYGAVTVPKQSKEKVKKESALFFGRLDDQTGILTYAAAVKQIKKTHPQFEFLVIGEGEYQSRLDKKVAIKKFQNNPEKYFDTYRFAFVSRYLSILEAFAAKRLVFAVYDNPVKEDYLRMAPYAKSIIIVKDSEDLTKKIAYYLEHPEEETDVITNAYTWVKEQTWENMAMLYLKLWKQKNV